MVDGSILIICIVYAYVSLCIMNAYFSSIGGWILFLESRILCQWGYNCLVNKKEKKYISTV